MPARSKQGEDVAYGYSSTTTDAGRLRQQFQRDHDEPRTAEPLLSGLLHRYQKTVSHADSLFDAICKR